ncbi:YhdP family protein [Photobacterium lucens]|uniref:YhdP family protein n=1 Tax=Photobacterium lucens TaxID=2562949 RepID=UPI00136F48CA|nr:YhdP family protein [Photobacterium lucens]MBP2700522.1 TIGR02099 family protein [Vibrio parahaemolyticus]MZG56349.1 TIGR02099 family protein [Photobacterium lucens]MZG79749.1 TIGR02099 family protein [Photobacterium lucens]
MNRILVKLLRGILWFVVIGAVTLAVLISAIRLLLPHIDNYRQPLTQWLSQQTHTQISASHIEGHWRPAGPEITLTQLSVAEHADNKPLVEVGRSEIYFDFWRSVLTFRPVFKTVQIAQFDFDVTQLPDSPSATSSSDVSLSKRLEQLFFTRIDDVILKDATITVPSPSGKLVQLAIKQLNWRNDDGRHLAQGTIGVVNSQLGKIEVRLDITEDGGLPSLSGIVYLKGQDISVTPWLNKKFAGVADITDSSIGLQAWLTLDHGKIQSATLQLANSHIDWATNKKPHQIVIHDGVVTLQPEYNNAQQQVWRVDTEQFDLATDDIAWPQFDIAAQFALDKKLQLTDWKATLTNIELERLLPLISFLPKTSSATEAIKQLQPTGLVTNIRVAGGTKQAPHFSFNVDDLAFKQWQLLPGINKLNAHVVGDTTKGTVALRVDDDALPYGTVFPKPLNIHKADIHANWYHDENTTTLWSDKLNVVTPDLQAKGQFRLDFYTNAPTWLAFYGEVSIKDAGQTWRYLPRPALGNKLTHYLATAIKGGTVKDAKLLWFGPLNTFPYPKHDGIFKVDVPLKKAKFQFDPQWPLLTDLDLDLGFKNDRMTINASHVKTMSAIGSNVIGDAKLAEDGHLNLALDIAAQGKDVTDYMLATPLADSVGSALQTVAVDGPVSAKLNLDIPFDGSDVDAKGEVFFDNNRIDLATPPLTVEHTKGSLSFDNAKIEAKGLTGKLLQQPITLGFTGNSVASDNYRVNVGIAGDWQVADLKPYMPMQLSHYLSGTSAWNTAVQVDLNGDNFTYKVKSVLPLAHIKSDLPYPLHHQPKLNQSQFMTVNVDGDAQGLNGLLQLPDAAYQAHINLINGTPQLASSDLMIGKKDLKSALGIGHVVSVDTNTFDIDPWITLASTWQQSSANNTSVSHDFTWPIPNKITAKVKQLTLGGLVWNDVDLVARHGHQWSLKVDSRQAAGYITWDMKGAVNAIFKRLHINVPQWDKQSDASATATVTTGEPSKIEQTKRLSSPMVTDADRHIMASIPAIDLTVSDAWLQGYRLGQVSAAITKSPNALTLKKLSVSAGNISLDANGRWAFKDDRNHTDLDFTIKGKNSSDLLHRFGIEGGVQNASFNTQVSSSWLGSPWAMERRTLNGKVTTDIGKGLVSGAFGAGRLLGLFSLDSIIRKMQLDFSGVFDNGLAFNYIQGAGVIKQGIFHSDNIKMQALAGDMYIKGKVNLINETVDANVKFIPDFTSGLPVLTAFAVAPQTALYVFAISTVLSPVLDVITQVNYQVTGPIDAPKVLERSRLSGEYSVPEE